MPYLKLLAICWTLPNTALGCCFGILGLCLGGQSQFKRGVLEYYGGLVAWILSWLPNQPIALTLGHTILGRDAHGLDRARDHEHVHVRQYERWGIFFIPAYLVFSVLVTLRGKNPYYDNPFEVDAYTQFPSTRPLTGIPQRSTLSPLPKESVAKPKNDQTQQNFH